LFVFDYALSWNWKKHSKLSAPESSPHPALILMSSSLRFRIF
jgi:hypothetical protein